MCELKVGLPTSTAVQTTYGSRPVERTVGVSVWAMVFIIIASTSIAVSREYFHAFGALNVLSRAQKHNQNAECQTKWFSKKKNHEINNAASPNYSKFGTTPETKILQETHFFF